jgi:hypothetical protein
MNLLVTDTKPYIIFLITVLEQNAMLQQLLCFWHLLGVPGKDSWTVSTVRCWKISVLGGVEEFWVPILIRILSAVLATILTAVALADPAAWKLCMWVWYVYSIVSSIEMKNYGQNGNGSQLNKIT